MERVARVHELQHPLRCQPLAPNIQQPAGYQLKQQQQKQLSHHNHFPIQAATNSHPSHNHHSYSHFHHHHICSQLTAQNKRKEKARIAARARRSQEACIIMEMADELHISQEKMKRIDKATIVKLTIDYIKAFEFLCRRPTPQPFATSSKQQGVAPLIDPAQLVSQPEQQTQFEGSQYELEQENRNELQSENQQDGGANVIAAQPATYSMPKLSTTSIFAPKTDDMNTHFLVIDKRNGKPALVLKPDTEVLDEDDLTHLAPQAGDVSIPLEAEPLDDIILDRLL